jgi:prepilin-type processing-associated H-X9-DG protein
MDTDSNAWVAGNLKLTPDSTNKTLILRCKFFPYSSQLGTYRCPSDSSETGGTPRTRSYSMNSWVGSRFMETNEFKQNDFRTFVSDGEIAAAGASRIWVLIDEHESTIDDGLFMVTMDDRQPFASAPAMRHNRGYTLTFGDGHVEYFALRDPNSGMIGNAQGQVSAKNTDWLRLKQFTTIR